MNLIILCLVILIVVLYICLRLKKKEKKKTFQARFYKKPLMTKSEMYFYSVFRELENELNVRVNPQVNLATIVKKESSSYYVNELFRNIDFGIFTKDYSDILLLIEINDKSHQQKSRQARDIKVHKIASQANIKLITFYTNYPNTPEYVKNRIKNELLNTEKTTNSN